MSTQNFTPAGITPAHESPQKPDYLHPGSPLPAAAEDDEHRDIAFRTPSQLQHADAPLPTVVRITKWKLAARFGMLIVLVAIFRLVGEYGIPYCRPFSWDDRTIDRPGHPDTFPNWSLFFITISPLPIAALLAWAAPIFPQSRRWEYVEWLFTTILTSVLQMMMMEPTKLYAGRLRPDFLQRLGALGYNSSTTGVDYCELRDPSIIDGRKSFPSGHSSTSFSALTLMTLILLNRLRAFRQPDFRVGYFLVCIIPLTLAFVVAVSRTRDDRHHFADILAGSVIGVIAALLAFKLQFTYCPKRLCYIPTEFCKNKPLPPIVQEEVAVIL